MDVSLADVDPAVPSHLGGLHIGQLWFGQRSHEVCPKGPEHPLLAVGELERAQGASRGPAISGLWDPDEQLNVPADDLPDGPCPVRGDQDGLPHEASKKARRDVV